MMHTLHIRARHIPNVSYMGVRSKSVNIQLRYLGGMMKQERPEEDATEIEVDGLILDMSLKEMNVMSSYLDTYQPILHELKKKLDSVNNQYVYKSITIGIGKFIWKNEAAKTAEIKITELANDIEEISEKLNTFCNRVDNVSNANFDKLFENIGKLSDKCGNEVITKQRIIELLNEQQELVANMRQDINATQIRLEEMQMELRHKTDAYDKLNAQYAKGSGQTQEDMNRFREMNKELQKRYSKYTKRYSIGFAVCTLIIGAVAAWYYNLYEQEMQNEQRLMEEMQDKQHMIQGYEGELQNKQRLMEKMENEQRSMKEIQTVYMIQEKQFENMLIEKEDVLMKQTEQIEVLQQKLDVASKRGLWSYIFG